MRGTWRNTAFADRHEAWGRFLRSAWLPKARAAGRGAPAACSTSA